MSTYLASNYSSKGYGTYGYCQAWVDADLDTETSTTYKVILKAQQQLVGAYQYGLQLGLSYSGDGTGYWTYDDYWTVSHSDGDWYPSDEFAHTVTFTKGTSAKTITIQANSSGKTVSGYGAYDGSAQARTTFTVPALASYTVTYNANGGSGAPSSQTKYYGQTLTLSTTKPTRSGYSFAGWATSSSGSVAYAAGASYTGNAALTLYAVWTAATTNNLALSATSGTITYSATTTTFTYTTSSSGTVTVTTSNSSVATATVNTSTKTVTITRKGYGSATITVTQAASGQYKSGSKGFTVTCARATPTTTISATSKTITYSTTTASVTYTYNGDGTPTVSTSNSSVATATISTSNKTVTITRKGYGSATITIAFPAGTNYNAGTSRTCTVTCAKATPTTTISATSGTITYPTTTTSFTYTYTGDGTPTVSSSSTSIATASINTSSKTVTVTRAGYGSATITVAFPAGTNYLAGTSRTFTVTCAKGAGSGSVTMSGWTYGGSVTNPVPSSSTNGTSNVTYTWYNSSSTVLSAKPTSTSTPGTYYVAATFPATTNYNAYTTGKVSFTIAKANDTVTLTLASNLTYTGSAQALVTAFSTESATGYVGLGSSSTSAPTTWAGKASQLTATNAGTYYVWYKTNGNDNYNAIGATYKGSVAIINNAAASDLEAIVTSVQLNAVMMLASQNSSTSMYTTSSSGAVTVTIEDTSIATISLDSAAKTITYTRLKAGTTNITISQAATPQYKAGTVTFKLIIQSKTPTISLSKQSDTIIYPATSISYTYTYNGDGGNPTVVSENSQIATATLNTSNKTVTVTRTGFGVTTITLTFPKGDNYSQATKKFSITCSRANEITYYDDDGAKKDGTVYFYDSSGTKREVLRIVYYDASGNRYNLA